MSVGNVICIVLRRSLTRAYTKR